MIRLKKYENYKVLWADAASDDGWFSVEDCDFGLIEKGCQHVTYGTLIHQTKQSIFMTHTYNTAAKRALGLLILPKGMILKIGKLK